MFVKKCDFKQVLKFLPLSLMLLMMLYSCLKEEEFVPNEAPALTAEQLKIRAAKAWFEQHLASAGQVADSITINSLRSGQGNSNGQGNGNGNGQGNGNNGNGNNGNGNNGNGQGNGNWNNGNNPRPKAKPKWEQARLGVDNVVEVPLETFEKISYARGTNATDEQLASAITQLVIVNNDGEPLAAFMHIVADSSYLAEKGYDLSQNYYKDLADDFSGMVFYTFLDGEFCNGWRYENGQITATISYDGNLTAPEIDDDIVSARFIGTDCNLITIEEYFQWCTLVIDTHSGNYRFWCDQPKLTGSYSFFECSGGISGGGGGIVPGNGGGNSGNNNNNDPPPAESYTVTVTASQGGTVSGGGIFTEGKTCSISARPNTGFVFYEWESSLGYTSKRMSFSFNVYTNETLTAHFLAASTYSDCDQNSNLNQNDSITKRINILKNEAQTLGYEVGRYEIVGPDGIPDIKYHTDYHPTHVTFPTPSPYYNYNWLFHTHIVGAIPPVPSHGDIFAIIQGYLQLRVRDDESYFAYGIVNANGTAYAITIGDPSAFQRFITDNDLYNEDAKWYGNLRDRLLKAGTNEQRSERILMEALRNSGLSVMRSRNSTPTNAGWQVVEWRNNSVATKPCN